MATGAYTVVSWGFLLGTMMANAYKLDKGWGKWKTCRRDHLAWRNTLVKQLFSTFSPYRNFRIRARSGYFTDRCNDTIPAHQHKRGQRGKRSVCVICQASYLKSKSDAKKARKPFASMDANAPVKTRPSGKVKGGCLTCDVWCRNRKIDQTPPQKHAIRKTELQLTTYVNHKKKN